MNVLCCLGQVILCQLNLLTELTAYSPVVFIKDFRSRRDRQLRDIADTSFLTQHDDQFLVLFCLVPDAAMLRDDASANILRHRTHLPSAQKRSDHCTGQIIRYPPPNFQTIITVHHSFSFLRDIPGITSYPVVPVYT